MEIQLAAQEPHTILSYSSDSIVIYGKTYQNPLIVSREHIHSPWAITRLADLSINDLPLLLAYEPEIILLGHTSNDRTSEAISSALSQQRIGLECMTIGAACRTFNVLLSEGRAVILGLIF